MPKSKRTVKVRDQHPSKDVKGGGGGYGAQRRRGGRHGHAIQGAGSSTQGAGNATQGSGVSQN